MTVSWEAVETALQSFVEGALTASGLGTGANKVGVCWRDRSDKDQKTAPYVELSISAEVARGHDEAVLEEVGTSPASVLVPRVTGVREFTLQVRIRSRSQKADKTSRNVAEVLRASLYHPYLRAILDTAGVAFLQTSGTGSAATSHEGRYESVFILDVRFATKSELYLPDQSGVPVEAVEITPTLADSEYPTVEIP